MILIKNMFSIILIRKDGYTKRKKLLETNLVLLIFKNIKTYVVKTKNNY